MSLDEDHLQLLDDIVYLRGRGAMTGIAVIATARRRQLEEHDYTLEHDRGLEPGTLAGMASLRAAGSAQSLIHNRRIPLNPAVELPKAGALLAAEIDRIGGR